MSRPRKSAALAETLDVLAAKAEGLRKAGVLRATVGEFSFELAPSEPPMEKGDAIAQDYVDPLHDPATYGARPGGRIPGFPRQREDGI